MRISKSTKTDVKASKKSIKASDNCNYDLKSMSDDQLRELLTDVIDEREGYDEDDMSERATYLDDLYLDIDNELASRHGIKGCNASTSTVKASNKTSSFKSMSDDQLEKLLLNAYEELDSYGEDDMSNRVLYLEDLCTAINKELDCRKSNKSCNSSTSTDKALQHIKAAIDILGKSGKKDAVTKDSIANLGVVMFDLKSKK